MTHYKLHDRCSFFVHSSNSTFTDLSLSRFARRTFSSGVKDISQFRGRHEVPSRDAVRRLAPRHHRHHRRHLVFRGTGPGRLRTDKGARHRQRHYRLPRRLPATLTPPFSPLLHLAHMLHEIPRSEEPRSGRGLLDDDDDDDAGSAGTRADAVVGML